MPEKATQQAQDAKIIQLIIFHLGDEEFGVPIGEVREIIRTGPVTPIPDAPGYIQGVINVRGEIAAVIDLEVRFSLGARKEGAAPKHILITEQETNLFGLVVDEVSEVLRVSEQEIKAAPEVMTRVHQEYVTGVITLQDRLIILLELTKVLSEEELAGLEKIRRQQPVPEAESDKPAESTEPSKPDKPETAGEKKGVPQPSEAEKSKKQGPAGRAGKPQKGKGPRRTGK